MILKDHKTAAGRPYNVYLPNSYAPALTHPVILVHHGGGGNMVDFAAYWYANGLGESDKYIIVFPQASARPNAPGEHNWNTGFSAKGTADSDDVTYIQNVIQELTTNYNVDPSLIFAAGHSNGGMFVYRLAKELNHIFRGVCVSAGTAGGQNGLTEPVHFNFPESPSRKISFLGIHNINDTSVRYNPSLDIGIPDDLTGHERYDWYVYGRREVGFWPSVYPWLKANKFDPETPQSKGTVGTMKQKDWMNNKTMIRLLIDSKTQNPHHWLPDFAPRIMEFFDKVAQLQNP